MKTMNLGELLINVENGVLIKIYALHLSTVYLNNKMLFLLFHARIAKKKESNLAGSTLFSAMFT